MDKEPELLISDLERLTGVGRSTIHYYLRKGLLCFIYPLVNFSEDKHILEAAQSRVLSIEDEIQDKEEVIRAYEMIFLST